MRYIEKIVVFLALSTVFLFAGPVSYYGRMKASGNRIVGENTDTPVQVRGMSFYWSCTDWGEGNYARFWTAATVDAMVDGWKSEILRAAMAADNNQSCGDYQNNKNTTLQMVKTVVNRAIEKDIYVIVDWHSHKAHEQQSDAISFFVTEMQAYHNDPHVIFEIYNEPKDPDNANQWTTIKPYMQAVVNAIRNAGANNLILIGTPYYDQNPEAATASPVTGNDLAYVLHFYAAQHTLESTTIGRWRFNDESKTFRNVATKALNDGYPLFVSEYGTVNADGGGSPSSSETDKWHTFMDTHKISSCNWSISNVPEGASIFTSGFSIPNSGSDAAWTNTNNMTTSGKYIFNKLTGYATNAEWRNAPPPSSSSGGGSSSSGTSPIMLSQVVSANKAQIVKNGVSLQVVNNASLEIFNLKGNLLYKQDFSSGAWPVQLSSLPKGLYIVRVSFGSSREILQIPVR